MEQKVEKPKKSNMFHEKLVLNIKKLSERSKRALNEDEVLNELGLCDLNMIMFKEKEKGTLSSSGFGRTIQTKLVVRVGLTINLINQTAIVTVENVGSFYILFRGGKHILEKI